MRGIFVAFAMVISSPALALDEHALEIRVVRATGEPVANTVVVLQERGSQAVTPPQAGSITIEQRGQLFQPMVSVIHVGSEVVFTNQDNFRHHVYSLSKPKRFELSLFSTDEVRDLAFDKPGIVALGCNIHDNMLGFLYIADTGIGAVSDAEGRVAFAGQPPGQYTVQVWHPGLDAHRKDTVALSHGEPARIVIDPKPVVQRPPDDG